jgi:hypothetical protein
MVGSMEASMGKEVSSLLAKQRYSEALADPLAGVRTRLAVSGVNISLSSIEPAYPMRS